MSLYIESQQRKIQSFSVFLDLISDLILTSIAPAGFDLIHKQTKCNIQTIRPSDK